MVYGFVDFSKCLDGSDGRPRNLIRDDDKFDKRLSEAANSTLRPTRRSVDRSQAAGVIASTVPCRCRGQQRCCKESIYSCIVGWCVWLLSECHLLRCKARGHSSGSFSALFTLRSGCCIFPSASHQPRSSSLAPSSPRRRLFSSLASIDLPSA